MQKTDHYRVLVGIDARHVVEHIGTVHALLALEIHVLARFDASLRCLVDGAERHDERIRICSLAINGCPLHVVVGLSYYNYDVLAGAGVT